VLQEDRGRGHEAVAGRICLFVLQILTLRPVCRSLYKPIVHSVFRRGEPAFESIRSQWRDRADRRQSVKNRRDNAPVKGLWGCDGSRAGVAGWGGRPGLIGCKFGAQRARG
jgi:hypothetical protein